MQAQKQTVSVIICAYTEARWQELQAAVASIHAQSYPAQEIIVVIDHNATLFAKASSALTGVTVIENHEERGLSGARNSGIAAAQGEILAFMDEDAVAEADWLARLLPAYDDPAVLGVGGAIVARWAGGRPGWFPQEFDWVVGCTYRGLPTTTAPVRNLIGCNMSFRRELFATVGGFRNGMGRVGTRPVGCEETELCIRIHQQWPHVNLCYEPQARVLHHVPLQRATWGYFRARCYAEGLSKAQVAHHVGANQGLASERTYTLRTLPLGVLRGLVDLFRLESAGLLRALAIIAGLFITTLGYLSGHPGRPQPITPSAPPRKQAATGEEMQPQSTVTTNLSADTPVENFVPTRLLELELSQPLPTITAINPDTGYRYQRGLALVRLHEQPVGVAELTLATPTLEPASVAQAIWGALREPIIAQCQAEGLPAPSGLPAAGLPALITPRTVQARQTLLKNAPFVSVVVATHNRVDSLPTALDSLLAQHYPHFEIIVVDNAPKDNATAELIQRRYATVPAGRQVRYVREDRPGLAMAHNSGLRAVRASIVAFTDDDVRADPHWLAELVRGFAAGDKVGCVTGMIFPAELETAAQGWIEQFGFSKGFTQRLYDRDTHRPANPLHPYTAGVFGSGANMAFRTETLRTMGGFDPALGAGSKAMGGDDLEAFFQVIMNGYQLVYQPSAIVHHWHRRDYAGLCRQAYGYGVGLTAYLMKTLWERPSRLLDFVVRVPYGLYFTFSKASPKHQKKATSYPRELTRLEYKGMLYGPLAYLRSRWHTRHWPALSLPTPQSATPVTSPRVETVSSHRDA